jgi:hypothetical protein
MRNAFLLVSFVLFILLGGRTAAVAAQSGLDILTLTSVLFVVMIMLAVLGALRNPPGR